MWDIFYEYCVCAWQHFAGMMTFLTELWHSTENGYHQSRLCLNFDIEIISRRLISRSSGIYIWTFKSYDAAFFYGISQMIILYNHVLRKWSCHKGCLLLYIFLYYIMIELLTTLKIMKLVADKTVQKQKDNIKKLHKKIEKNYKLKWWFEYVFFLCRAIFPIS